MSTSNKEVEAIGVVDQVAQASNASRPDEGPNTVIRKTSATSPKPVFSGNEKETSDVQAREQGGEDTIEQVRTESATLNSEPNPDPLGFSQHKCADVSKKQLKADHPKGKPRKLKKFYTRQNALIDQFLGSGDEERLAALDLEENGGKIKIAVYGSFLINLGLFAIQLYAAISTGSLSLFATATDAFVCNCLLAGEHS